MKNIYFVNGFLDAGKTTFIKELLGQEYFDTGEKTLLLLCEDGDTEYEDQFCREHNVIIRWVKEEANFTEQNIQCIEDEVQPERIIVEFNGMWDSNEILSRWEKDKVLEIVIINAESFELYLSNMKSYMTRQIRSAYMTIFRSCDGMEDKLARFRRSIRAVNPQTNFVFKNKDGEMNPRLDEDLPYDISKDEILLEEDDYPVWYMDVFDNFEKYYGKTIRFKTFVRDILDETFVIGRNVMTCCEDDIQFLGYEVINETNMLVGIGDVIFLECNVVHEYSEFAKEEVVLLRAKKIFKLPYEKDKVLSF